MENATVMLLVGIGVGFVVAKFLISPGSSDRLVAQGVRDKVGAEFGGTVQSVGDALGIWTYTPGLAGLTT